MPCPCAGWCRCAFDLGYLRTAYLDEKAHSDWRRLKQWAEREERRETDRKWWLEWEAEQRAWRGEAPLSPPPDDDDDAEGPFRCDCIARRCNCKRHDGEQRRPKRRRV